VVDVASEAGRQPILVVLGSETELVQGISSELKNSCATSVANPNWKGGIGTSIPTGVQQLIDIAPGLRRQFCWLAINRTSIAP
jgi:CTP:molybdopterin cytidylyltransferase MocA